MQVRSSMLFLRKWDIYDQEKRKNERSRKIAFIYVVDFGQYGLGTGHDIDDLLRILHVGSVVLSTTKGASTAMITHVVDVINCAYF